MHEVFQYKLVLISPISVNPTLLEKTLNEMGLEGWYVLSAQPDYILLERVHDIVDAGMSATEISAGL